MLPEPILNELRAIVGREQVHSGPAELIAYSYDGTYPQRPPDVVVTPASYRGSVGRAAHRAP